jgi:hypothetical protein
MTKAEAQRAVLNPEREFRCHGFKTICPSAFTYSSSRSCGALPS